MLRSDQGNGLNDDAIQNQVVHSSQHTKLNSIEPYEWLVPPSLEQRIQGGRFNSIEIIDEIENSNQVEVGLRPIEYALDVFADIRAVPLLRIDPKVQPPHIYISGKQSAKFKMDRSNFRQLPTLPFIQEWRFADGK